MNETLENKDKYYVILLPFFNESNLLSEFLAILESKLKNIKNNFKLIFINDGSTDNSVDIIRNYKVESDNISLEITNLKGNVGQQNAIRKGLIYVKNKHAENIKGVIVMDADGEDDPDAIEELINLKNFDVIFVSRGRRKESLLFKISYFIYKITFRFITGKQINFGNYSLISPKVLDIIAEKHFFHFSAFLSKQRFKTKKIKYNRNKRLKGTSKMGFKNLLIHALKSFIEYYEDLIFFQIKVFLIILISFSSVSVYIIYSKFVTKKALIGWSSNLMIGLINGLLIMFSSIIISTLLVTIKNTLDQKNES